MSPAAPPLLDEPHAAFVQSGVAIDMASHEAGLVPVVARGVACRVSPDRRAVTVFLAASRAERFLAAVAGCGAVAAVFCHPGTLETIQLKGSDAVIVAPELADPALVERAVDAFVAKVAPLGFSERLARAELHVPPGTLAAIRLTIAAAFIQTPGPSAGARI